MDTLYLMKGDIMCKRLSSLVILIVLSCINIINAGVVTNNNDSGPGSLRQVIGDAPNSDTIFFTSTATNIFLSSSLTLNKNLFITGTNNPKVVINGTTNQRIFSITSTNTVSITNNIILTGGNLTNDNGGAIYNSGSLYIANSNLVYNSSTTSTSGGEGGAIFNFGGKLTLVSSTISYNNANTGGAIFNLGTVTGTNLTFSYNTGEGGAVYNLNTMDLTNTIFDHNSNSVTGHGGAIATLRNLTLTDCIFTNNTALTRFGGAIDASGIVTLNISTGKNLTYAGNAVYLSGTAISDNGGFLYMNQSTTTAFNVDGTLAIGDSTSLTNQSDSIASYDTTSLITKTGTGTLLLNADNSGYHGSFQHQQGRLTVNGKLNADDASLVVSSGAILDGKGSIGGITTLVSGARLFSDQSAGALAFNNLSISGGTILEYQLTASNLIDQRFITSNALTLDFTADSSKIILLLDNLNPVIGQTYTFLDFGSMNLLTNDASSTDYNNYFQLGNGLDGDFSSIGNSLQVTILAIPEPSSWQFLIVGFFALFVGIRSHTNFAKSD